MDWTAVGGQIANLLLGVFGTALGTLAVIAVKKLADKWHIEIGAAQQAALESAADKAVHAAEEASRTTKKSGSEKLDFAFGVVRDILGSQTFAQYGKPRIEASINAALNAKRQAGEIPDPPKPDDTEVIPATVAASLGLK